MDTNSRQIQNPMCVERLKTLLSLGSRTAGTSTAIDEKLAQRPAAVFTLRRKVTILCSAKYTNVKHAKRVPVLTVVRLEILTHEEQIPG
jgi:hypothetical protein